MSKEIRFAEEILTVAGRKPKREVIRPGYSRPIDRGDDPLKELGTIGYCQQICPPSVELHLMPKGVIAELLKYLPECGTEYRQDLVAIGHGPLGFRAGGIPYADCVGMDMGWNTNRNDSEITFFVTGLTDQQVITAIKTGVENGIALDLNKRSTQSPALYGVSEITTSGWNTPSWNLVDSTFGLPNIKPYIKTQYSYWSESIYPAYDFHFITPTEGISLVDEFLALYGTSYSTLIGLPMLACFVKKDGSLDQRIWQPFKLQKGPKEHFIRISKPEILTQLPWVIPESARMALTAIELSACIRKKPASICSEDMKVLRVSVSKQAECLRKTHPGFLEEKAPRKLATFLHRVDVMGSKEAQELLLDTLEEMDWIKNVLQMRRQDVQKLI